jgi:hypothetical protein
MSAESPSAKNISSQSGPRAGHDVPWLAVAAIAALVFGALLRWAIDGLLLVCVLLLLAHSTRDTLQDWLAGESFQDEADPIWAVAAVCIAVLGVAISGFWLFSSSELGGRLADRYVPAALTETVAVGERLGWGRRAFWPGSSRFVGKQRATEKASRAASVGSLGVSTPGSFAPSDPADPDVDRGGTAQQQAPVATTGRLATTTTSLRSSASGVERGMAVTLSAKVAAPIRPMGTVVFRRGSRTLGTVNVDADGGATLVLSDLPPGTHDITAEFPGSSTLRSSRSASIQVTVR